MGQKIHPNGFRVGITEGWNSRWFAPKKLFGELLIEDQKIRAFVDKKLNRQPPNAAVAKVEIERTREELKVVLHTARPGVVIGPKGAEIARVEKMINGSIPLHTLQANISYGQVHCQTPYGVIGIKVWIYQGTYAETDAQAQAAGASAVRRPRRR